MKSLGCGGSAMLGKGKGKTWVVKALIILVVCWLGSLLLALRGNPEVNFWSEVVKDKVQRARDLQASSEEPVVFIGGGSSASFSIHEGAFLEEVGLVARNMGGSGAMGYRYVVNLAFSEAKKGDIVILHMTPESLAERERLTKALGIRVAIRRGQYSFAEGGEVFPNDTLGSGDALLALRPGLKFLGTLAGKIAARRPLYSYSLDHYTEGVMTIPNGGPTKDVEGFSPASENFNEGTAEALSEIADYAKREGIRVFFTLPWECFQVDVCAAMRAEHEIYLREVERFVPVLRDRWQGAHDRPEDFLDTGFHLNLEAGRKRSEELAKSLKRALEAPEGDS